MRQRALLCLIVLACASAACDGFVLFVSTGPLPPAKPSPTSPTPPVPVHPIVVGQVVTSTFVVPQVCFDVTAPTTGNLIVVLSWDRGEGDIDLALGSTVFALPANGAYAGAASLVGNMRVTAGQSYRVTVAGNRGPVPFTLTTSVR